MTVRDHRQIKPALMGGSDIQAKLMLLLLCLMWGITWPVMKIALNELPPLSMRASAAGISALTMLVICIVNRRSFRISTARAWAHVVAMSLLNIVGVNLLNTFAQLATATSRVAMVAYTMPIWTVLLAWVALRERPSRIQVIAVLLCVAGLAILIYPLTANGLPCGALLAVASGLSWAAGTVYVKWARIEAEPLGVTSWQLTIAFFVIGACRFMFEGPLDLSTVHADAVFAVAFTGVFGSAVAYSLWFEIVRRLPAATASLAILGSPVIGVVTSMLILGERPSVTDLIGFAFISAASACVVLTARVRRNPSA